MTEVESPQSGAQTPAVENLFDAESGTSTPNLKRGRGRPRRVLSDDSDNESGTPLGTRSRRFGVRGDPRYIRKSERISASIVPEDAIMEPQHVVDDETVLAHFDQEGERKVDENGFLFGNREYRVRTFTVLGRGKRLYMLSTEPAREFGAKIIIGGRRIIDDYWVKEYKSLGFQEGALADPEDLLPPPGVEYNRNQYVAWHGASSVYHREPPIERRSTRRVPAINDANWISAHAHASSQYNSELWELRRRMRAGIHEPHLALKLLPTATQSQAFTWEPVANPEQSDRNFLLDVSMDIRAAVDKPPDDSERAVAV
ncbi:hypothetical protein MRB53_039060 [Persea americana]|nr:hypothetical protein MRB53_039060 [Persea americana]